MKKNLKLENKKKYEGINVIPPVEILENKVKANDIKDIRNENVIKILFLIDENNRLTKKISGIRNVCAFIFTILISVLLINSGNIHYDLFIICLTIFNLIFLFLTVISTFIRPWIEKEEVHHKWFKRSFLNLENNNEFDSKEYELYLRNEIKSKGDKFSWISSGIFLLLSIVFFIAIIILVFTLY